MSWEKASSHHRRIYYAAVLVVIVLLVGAIFVIQKSNFGAFTENPLVQPNASLLSSINFNLETVQTRFQDDVTADQAVAIAQAAGAMSASKETDGANTYKLVLPKFIDPNQVVATLKKDGKVTDADAQTLSIPGTVMVGFKEGTSETDQAATLRTVTATKNDGLSQPQLRVVALTLPQATADSQKKVIDDLKKDPHVAFAETNFYLKAHFTPNDPLFPPNNGYIGQYGLVKVHAPEAWDLTQGSATVNIADLDTGIQPFDGTVIRDRNSGTRTPTEDFLHKIVGSYNAITHTSCRPTKYDNTHYCVFDDVGHGTMTAGVAAVSTNNSVGVAGAGFNSSLIIVRVLDGTGSGTYADAAGGIVWATDHGAKVINMSFGGSQPSSDLEAAVNYAWSHDVVLVASAGNNGTNAPSYPAYYNNVIAVAATDSNDALASFSEYGSWVDVAAPGVNIMTTAPTAVGLYIGGSGTSFSAPFVVGEAALILAKYPTSTNLQVRQRIESTTDGTYPIAHGRINAFRALQ